MNCSPACASPVMFFLSFHGREPLFSLFLLETRYWITHYSLNVNFSMFGEKMLHSWPWPWMLNFTRWYPNDLKELIKLFAIEIYAAIYVWVIKTLGASDSSFNHHTKWDPASCEQLCTLHSQKNLGSLQLSRRASLFWNWNTHMNSKKMILTLSTHIFEF